MNGQLAVDLVYNLGRADEPDLWNVELISQLVLGDSVDLWNVELISQLVLGKTRLFGYPTFEKTPYIHIPTRPADSRGCGA